MQLDYVSLLSIQRQLMSIPRGSDRFEQYLKTLLDDQQRELALAPLVMINPMAKDHVARILDQLIAFDADTIGAQTCQALSQALTSVQGNFKAALVVVDDAHGAGTNRYSYEYELRFGVARLRQRSTQSQRQVWVTGILWTSETVDAAAIRVALASAAYRVAYMQAHGYPQTLGEMLRQEGWVLAQAGSQQPTLDPDDLEYTRAILEPQLDQLQVDDLPNTMSYVFGDQAGHSLGYRAQGLSPWAGIALALHDARNKLG
ncbi:hypothetical protein [Herpetosiphon sp. NSE202]|uniref:hypothetical protein n=1 Tax=Herpetosiphon sp. NSE202 TaxID=3351349 RepID=UPI003631F4A6